MKIKAEKREIKGRKVKQLREKGLVPGEVYGGDFDNIHISIPANNLMKVYKEAGGNTVIDLEIGKESYPTLITDIQIDAISDKPLSVDFYKFKEGQKIETEVPINFIGESPLEKEGFVLVKVMRELKIESTPADLPSEVEVDMSEIRSEDDMVYAKDIKLPKGVEILDSPDTAIITIAEKREEAEEEPEEEGLIPEELELGTAPAESEEEGGGEEESAEEELQE